jgi:hypothetical protein
VGTILNSTEDVFQPLLHTLSLISKLFGLYMLPFLIDIYKSTHFFGVISTFLVIIPSWSFVMMIPDELTLVF